MKIIYLPLDERPCNYIYPQYIAEIGGTSMLVPPYELLGRFKAAANVDGLWSWLFQEAADVSHVVMSMDLMCYGGIVPSRLHHLSREVCGERLNRLEELKRKHPQLQIYAFSLITRAPARNGSGEEPDYYEQYGFDLFRYGVLTDKETFGITEKEAEEKRQILSRVPEEALNDFIQRRAVNLDSNMRLIELAAAGIIDHLTIPLDDCAEYGFASSERRRLAEKAASLGVLSKIAMYPGADEMGCIMVARALCAKSGLEPRVWVDYSSNTGKLTIPLYEDRTIGETVPHHVKNAGGFIAASPQEADIALMINPPTAFSNRIYFELDRRGLYLEPERNFPSFIDRARGYMTAGLITAIADCAIPNGADQCLMYFLHEQNLLNAITAFSGWNTSSNAMGTALAHAIAYFCAQKSGRLDEKTQKTSDKFRLMRYIEDWAYMTNIRQDIKDLIEQKAYGENVGMLNLNNEADKISAEVTYRLKEFTKKYFGEIPYEITATMPWNRMFEIDLRLNGK